MIWLRKGFVYFLSIILLICLIELAPATAFSRDLASPAKLKSWLASSKIYNQVIPAELEQAQTTANSEGNASSVSLSDPAVEQAAETAFPSSLVQNSVNTILDSNYNWLEGKAATPGFSIDLSSAKQQFATLVGQAAQNHLSSLPVCTAAQLTQISIPVDSVTVVCRPAMLVPQDENSRIAQEIETNSSFLNTTTITASTLNQVTQNQGGQGQPYYENLSWAPKAFQVVTKLPWILSGLGLLSTLGIIFIAPTRRRGMRRLGVVLVEAGLFLIVEKFVADALVKRLAKTNFHNELASQLKQPISDFLTSSESHLVKYYLLFGILFLVVGIAILVYIFKTRDGQSKPKKPVKNLNDDPVEAPQTTADDIRLAPRRTQPTDVAASRPTPQGTPTLGKTPPRPKRPRLIQ